MPRITPSAEWMSSSNDPQADDGDDLALPSSANGQEEIRETGRLSTSPILTRTPFNGNSAVRRRSNDTGSYHPPPTLAGSPESVRSSTLQLSSMVLPSKVHGANEARRRSSIGLSSGVISGRMISSSRGSASVAGEIEGASGGLDDVPEMSPTSRFDASPLLFPSKSSPITTPPDGSPSERERKPSGISILLAQKRSIPPEITVSREPGPMPSSTDAYLTPGDLESQGQLYRSITSPIPHSRALFARSNVPYETTPLLAPAESTPNHDTNVQGPLHSSLSSITSKIRTVIQSTQKLTHKDQWIEASITVTSCIPAVIIGLLLNILDGISYGIILFPASEIFVGFGSLGVSMFFVTTIISQLVYTFGGSSFPAVNGSMMIEIVPFFAILVQGITSYIGEENPHSVISTTMVAFALSSILTGIAFLLLGSLRLGALIGFFPRHILLGCIGGIGWFLIETGFEVSAGLNAEGFEYTVPFFRLLFMDAHILSLWLPALLLAGLLKLITTRYYHQLIFPMYFLTIPIVFYIIVAISGVSMGTLREQGWVFDIGKSEPWWKFYTHFDFRATSISALWNTMPTQLALLFFNVLHPPLNVPALAVTLDQEVDLNKELVAHGYSNLLAGIAGTVPNYEVYINSVLFYRIGGRTRLAGFFLALATVGLLSVGTAPIGFIPIMLVGALIFVLGLDLVKEAIWDTRHRVSRTEYITIISIMICMSVWDFVIGVLFGIIVSCVFFVVQSSQSGSIRALYTGESAMSSVRRPSAHRAYIREVAKQTTILRLQGFLFFGTCTYVEEAVRKLVDPVSWNKNPIRFLIVDLTLVPGVDVSAAEALIRIQRILASKQALLVLCGFKIDGPVGRSLASVELLKKENVELFERFGEAVEWTENAYLRAYFISLKSQSDTYEIPIKPAKQPFTLGESYANSPRRSHIYKVARRTLSEERVEMPSTVTSHEPFNTLMKAFSSYGTLDRDVMSPLSDYLTRIPVPEGTVLWRKGDNSDGLYIIESGVLRASYSFSDYSDEFVEAMVTGTLTGELSFLSGTARNATVSVERQAILWKLSRDNLERLEREKPEFAKFFLKLVLKAAKIEYDVLMASLAARQ